MLHSTLRNLHDKKHGVEGKPLNTSCNLARRPSHLPFPHDMEVKMINRLCPIFSIVNDDPVTIAQPLLLSNLLRNQ